MAIVEQIIHPLKKPCLMYSTRRLSIAIFLFLLANSILGQEQNKKPIELELGIAGAGAEAGYLGLYSKVNYPLSHSKKYFYCGIGLNIYADFIGEIEARSRLRNDIDMRMIPNLFIAYNNSKKNFDVSVEIPIGISIAITKGTLVNTNVNFERAYSNTEILWHYGLATSIKYKVSDKSKIGFYLFSSLVIDKAWSPPMIGLSWVKNFNTK